MDTPQSTSRARRAHLDETFGQTAALVERLEAEENTLIETDIEAGLSAHRRARLAHVQELLAGLYLAARPTAHPEARLGVVRGQDREATRTGRLYRSRGSALHAYLGACGIPSAEHRAVATAALGRQVGSFSELTQAEADTVRTCADSRRAGVARA
jgi:hypothetical protein